MCGIVGIFDFAKNRGRDLISTSILQDMTSEIHHRGPDDEGIYVSENRKIGLGFRRLSIIDLSSAGHQPMCNTDGSIWMVFNGEVYNHKDLRCELEKRGYKYRSQTDTETILYAYEEYGIDFLQKLYGMFAIAIWDSRTEQLLLIRDRVGVKPLYFTVQQETVFFASEIKALLKHPDITPDINKQGLIDYLTFYITPPGQTMFRDIWKLEAGHYLTVSVNGTINKRKYWDVDSVTEGFDDRDLQSEEFCIDNIRRLLRDSIKLRMVADVPFGVLLSGGIDSSLNVALMAEQMSRPVETFSAGFKEYAKYNELEHARTVAQRFGTNHQEILIDEHDTIDALETMAWHHDEPNADPACVPMYFVSKLVRDSGTIVAQVGEGADEEFSGYRTYIRELRYYQYYYNLIPNAGLRLANRVLSTFAADTPFADYSSRAANQKLPFLYGAMPPFTERTKPQLLDKELLKGLLPSERVPASYFDDSIPQQLNRDHLHRIIYYEIKNRLAELLLMRVDKMSMASSIEARVPFLDHRMVEFSFRVPSRLKIKNREPKYILKKAAEGIIPESIIYRRKQGFNSPIVEWLRTGKLTSHAYDIITTSQLVYEGILNKDYIEYMFIQHRSQKANMSKQIWSLLMLTLWYNRFIKN